MATNTPMLEVRDLHAYYGKSHILHGVDMHVGEGEIVALLGRNGVGRSTLAKSIMGMVRHEGEILLRGKNVSGLRTFEVAHKGIGYVPENRDIFPTLTVRQNLLLGEKRNPGQPKPRWQVEDMYQMFPRLKERENTAAGVLSGGEQQMVAIARALMTNPALLLLDEPMEGLAPIIVQELGRAIRALVEEGGMAVILVEQHARLALQLTQRALVLDRGRVVHASASADLLADAPLLQRLVAVA